MPYVALLLKKNCKNLGTLEFPLPDPLVITYA